MTICGDLTYWLASETGIDRNRADGLVKEIFDWLLTADVLSYLSKEMESESDLTAYCAAIAELRLKVPIGRKVE